MQPVEVRGGRLALPGPPDVPFSQWLTVVNTNLAAERLLKSLGVELLLHRHPFSSVDVPQFPYRDAG